MSVLIVDDSADNRDPLRSILERAGFTNILIADSAAAAFQRLGMNNSACDHTSIDVILMDIMMPQMDGIEACRRIKAVSWLRDIPIIMVTSVADSREVASAFSAGAMDYITKPVNVVELLARVHSARALKREMDCRKTREEELLAVTRQLEAANQKLERLSQLDGLTEIANRRSFDSFLDRAWRQAIRSSTPLSLIMIDIDHFKNYNDTYGHQRGDECLKQVACALNQVLHRPTDFLARYGGEEFAAVLSDTDLRGAEVVASSLHAHVDELNIPHEFSPSVDHVTLSLGVASGFPYRTQSQQALIYAADLALYQAKHEGRNRIRIANEVMNSSLDEISVRRAAPVTISPRQSAVKPKGE
jgi:diguanylate cyclase (GGDEF)-like protein